MSNCDRSPEVQEQASVHYAGVKIHAWWYDLFLPESHASMFVDTRILLMWS